MALSIFIDALPYTEVCKSYKQWFDNQDIALLKPNIAYSSSLHWQLYSNKYPDERGTFVDWVKEPETDLSIKTLSFILQPLDYLGNCGVLARKIMDRFVYRKNMFANIPFKFRPLFKEDR